MLGQGQCDGVVPLARRYLVFTTAPGRSTGVMSHTRK